MRLGIWAGLAALAVVGKPILASAQDPTASAVLESRDAALSRLASNYVGRAQVPGIVIAYGRTGEPTRFIAQGRLDWSESAAQADSESLWRIYSMTKPLTAMAAMALIEEGKLGLDQPVSDFFPEYAQMQVLVDPENSLNSRTTNAQITVRHLLTHTAGFGYSTDMTGPIVREYQRLGILPLVTNNRVEKLSRPYLPNSLREFAARLAKAPLLAEPGTAWNYSVSFDLLGAVIEAAAGEPYPQYLQRRIIAPLGMTSTLWQIDRGQAGRLATLYIWDGKRPQLFDPAADTIFLTPRAFPYGGAVLVTSARDYDRFLMMLANGGQIDGVRILKPETVALAMSNLLPHGVVYSGAPTGTGGRYGPKMGYGAGASVQLEDIPGGTAKGTYGWGGAGGTYAMVDPVNGIRALVMANYMPSSHWPLRLDLMDAVYINAER